MGPREAPLPLPVNSIGDFARRKNRQKRQLVISKKLCFKVAMSKNYLVLIAFFQLVKFTTSPFVNHSCYEMSLWSSYWLVVLHVCCECSLICQLLLSCNCQQGSSGRGRGMDLSAEVARGRGMPFPLSRVAPSAEHLC